MAPTALDLDKLTNDIQDWQVRRAAEYMTHAPNASINSVGGVITEINSVNFVEPPSVVGRVPLHPGLLLPGRSPVACRSRPRG